MAMQVMDGQPVVLLFALQRQSFLENGEEVRRESVTNLIDLLKIISRTHKFLIDTAYLIGSF